MLFKSAVQLINNKEHLTEKGLNQIHSIKTKSIVTASRANLTWRTVFS